MKTVKGQPITGARPQYSKKNPIVPDAKETSANEQAFIKEPPSPFKSNQQQGSATVASKASGGISTLEPKIQSGIQHSSPGVRALPSRGPIGQRKPINQSGQVNGRMGTSFPKRIGQNGSGFPSKRNARFYGE